MVSNTIGCVTFSDTHNLHNLVKLPKCDIAIFNGDFSGRGNKFEALHFFRWYSSQNQCKYKIMVPGNHDICFDPKFNDETHAQNWWLEEFKKQFNNIIILENSSVIIEGIKIWGSGCTVWRDGNRWGLNYRPDEIHVVWEKIPKDTDILVTHGPAYGILDNVLSKDGTTFHVGCEVLKQVIDVVKPKFHLTGHIHEDYGIIKGEHTTSINSSLLDINYYLVNNPIEFEIKKRG